MKPDYMNRYEARGSILKSNLAPPPDPPQTPPKPTHVAHADAVSPPVKGGHWDLDTFPQYS